MLIVNSVLSSSEVWSSLQRCDVYNAAKIILLCEIIHRVTSDSNDVHSTDTIFDKLLLLNLNVKDKVAALDADMLREASYAISLKEVSADYIFKKLF